MFIGFMFSYDRDVGMLFKQAQKKLKNLSTIGYKDLFDSLICPLHWHKYSERTKECIHADVMAKLIKTKCALITYNEEKGIHFISRIQIDHVYNARHSI